MTTPLKKAREMERSDLPHMLLLSSPATVNVGTAELHEIVDLWLDLTSGPEFRLKISSPVLADQMQHGAEVHPVEVILFGANRSTFCTCTRRTLGFDGGPIKLAPHGRVCLGVEEPVASASVLFLNLGDYYHLHHASLELLDDAH